jgi:hypothetical protein
LPQKWVKLGDGTSSLVLTETLGIAKSKPCAGPQWGCRYSHGRATPVLMLSKLEETRTRVLRLQRELTGESSQGLMSTADLRPVTPRNVRLKLCWHPQEPQSAENILTQLRPWAKRTQEMRDLPLFSLLFLFFLSLLPFLWCWG